METLFSVLSDNYCHLFKLLDHCPVFKDGTDANQLPSGWEEKTDPKTGCLYYVDHNTKSTTWTRPGQDGETQNDKNCHNNPLPGTFIFWLKFLVKILFN